MPTTKETIDHTTTVSEALRILNNEREANLEKEENLKAEDQRRQMKVNGGKELSTEPSECLAADETSVSVEGLASNRYPPCAVCSRETMVRCEQCDQPVCFHCQCPNCPAIRRGGACTCDEYAKVVHQIECPQYSRPTLEEASRALLIVGEFSHAFSSPEIIPSACETIAESLAMTREGQKPPSGAEKEKRKLSQNIKLRTVLEVLQQEIDFHQDGAPKITKPDPRYCEGFISGLKQAKELIEKVAEVEARQ